MVSYHPDPRPSLRARLRLALHDSRGKQLNRLVHHEPGRYSDLDFDPLTGELTDPHVGPAGTYPDDCTILAP